MYLLAKPPGPYPSSGRSRIIPMQTFRIVMRPLVEPDLHLKRSIRLMDDNNMSTKSIMILPGRFLIVQYRYADAHNEIPIMPLRDWLSRRTVKSSAAIDRKHNVLCLTERNAVDENGTVTHRRAATPAGLSKSDVIGKELVLFRIPAYCNRHVTATLTLTADRMIGTEQRRDSACSVLPLAPKRP